MFKKYREDRTKYWQYGNKNCSIWYLFALDIIGTIGGWCMYLGEKLQNIRTVPKSNQEIKVRPKPNSETCPSCHSINVMIYDQEHDCCFTCNSKWGVKG